MELFIDQLAVETLIGVYEWEKRIRQRLWVDIQITLPNIPALSDDINDVLDYAEFCKTVVAWFAEQSFALLERLMAAFLAFLSHRWKDVAFTVVIHKPGAVKAAKNIRLSGKTALS